MTGPRPTRMSPPVTEGGAKGARRREEASHRMRNWRVWDWRKKMERTKREMERKKQRRMKGLWRF